MERIKKRWLICLALALMLLSGCGAAIASAVSSTQEPTVLQVKRVNTETENHYAPFPPRTITDQQQVQRLYNAMLALPRFPNNPPGWLSCPLDRFVKYDLTFLHGQSILQEALYDPSGCPTLRIGKNEVLAPDRSFAQLFVQVVGISEKDLDRVPLYSCNIRTPCSSPTP
jgi:uncharacterized protein YceK